MIGVLSSLSEDLVAIVAKAGPAVVRVEARRRFPASGIVWSSDAVIVTAHHVVEQEDNIRIALSDGQTIPATLIGRDPATDVAALRAQVSGLTPPVWAEPDSLRVGHLVLALSRPGKTVHATLGIVSALGEGWTTPVGGRVDHYLQADVGLYPGFSGGPLVNAEGHILGLNTLALLRGIPITVPSPTVRRIVEGLLADGRIRRGFLGVGTQPVRLPSPVAQQLGQETGLLIVSVAPGSGAEKAGLLLGDTIVNLGGQPMRHMDDIMVFLGDVQMGTKLPIRILRGGRLRELSATVGERP
ncbi:MAG: trypsin-like peptidase domain-containing protein [Chloroflexi bacterium]|nr:trypsin-like peptidase domain-containing protein [Chloroflexota bacterium]